MHQYDGKVMQISRLDQRCGGWLVNFDGVDWHFHSDWLMPSIKHFAEPPKPPQPEYREPVLVADYRMACEFSDNGEDWSSGVLGGWSLRSGWISYGGVCWRHCRIKKDA